MLAAVIFEMAIQGNFAYCLFWLVGNKCMFALKPYPCNLLVGGAQMQFAIRRGMSLKDLVLAEHTFQGFDL